tara:strand:+ start:846 stop:1841 length:996 start_codon:yes stop_codon:yes gene_type:complete
MKKYNNNRRSNQQYAIKLSWDDKKQLLQDFPALELSYEKLIHKKVQLNTKNISHIFLSIPKGLKYFAWFRKYKSQNVCFVLKIGRNRKSISDIFIYNTSFRNILCSGKGTIVYGTIFNIKKHTFFNVENIYYFKGENISGEYQIYKLQYMNNLFNHIKQIAYTNNQIIFGLPIVRYNYSELLQELQNTPYEVYAIQNRHLYFNDTFYNQKITIDKKIYATFLIKATIMTDIYNLYLKDDYDEYIEHKQAYIPDIKTSIMMNKLFRNIRENENIDYIEESEDEEDFENISMDKYVDLKKECVMKCLFIKKFNSWIPIEITNGEIYHSNNIIN